MSLSIGGEVYERTNKWIEELKLEDKENWAFQKNDLSHPLYSKKSVYYFPTKSLCILAHNIGIEEIMADYVNQEPGLFQIFLFLVRIVFLFFSEQRKSKNLIDQLILGCYERPCLAEGTFCSDKEAETESKQPRFALSFTFTARPCSPGGIFDSWPEIKAQIGPKLLKSNSHSPPASKIKSWSHMVCLWSSTSSTTPMGRGMTTTTCSFFIY